MAGRSSTTRSSGRLRIRRRGGAGLIVLLFVVWPLSPASGQSWPDPACDLPEYESVTTTPFVLPVPSYLRRTPLGGDEAGIHVIRISGNPGALVGPVAPGKVWPELLTHRYSLLEPCNADATMCLLDVDRNRLKGVEGDRLNAILSCAGMNFHKLLRWAADFLRQIFYQVLFFQRASLYRFANF